MTILVGLLCKDGIVIGSDSSATFGTMQNRTIEQPTDKIEIIDSQVIIAGTGQVGLGQRFVHEIAKHWRAKNIKGSPTEVASHMCRIGIENFASTQARQQQYGALVAFPNSVKNSLCEFACEDFQPELKTDKLWYCSMGSGQSIVDPFLGLMRKTFWVDGPPTLQDGVFTVAWALTHAIDVNPGGVGGPIKIATLKEGKAKFLTPEEIQNHQTNVEEALEHLREYPKIMNGKGQGKDAPLNIPIVQQ